MGNTASDNGRKMKHDHDDDDYDYEVRAKPRCDLGLIERLIEQGVYMGPPANQYRAAMAVSGYEHEDEESTDEEAEAQSGKVHTNRIYECISIYLLGHLLI